VELSGRVAIVTGGAAGIGRAIVDKLETAGATVVVADVAAGADFPADIGNRDDVRALFDFTLERWERLDVLVNNAGGVFETWQTTLDVNLNGLVLATQLALGAMDGEGVVVNISSVAALGLEPYDEPDYAAAKAAVVRFTASLANHDGVRVNCVCPDWVDTPAVQRSLAEMTTEERAAVPPLVPADEIAEIALDLIRDDSSAGRVIVRFADEPGPRVLPGGRPRG
jgi:NAD(P)-dependent dehydrogenase (short-subunit alcohol dehydrogenase family)